MQPLKPPATFLSQAESFGIAFDPGDLERLGLYLALLLDANTRFNLTAVTDPHEAWMKHVFDSLTLLGPLTSAQAARIIDVGSGGGLPGMPLAIALPAVNMTLLEATGKKARFLEEAAGTLGLDNVTVISERAEVAGQDRERHREQYDVAVARAVGSLAVLLELTVPLVKVGGWVMTIKGKKAKAELEQAREAIRLLHCQPGPSTRTPTGTVVVVEKLRGTEKRYPRRPGEPKRAPLGHRG